MYNRNRAQILADLYKVSIPVAQREAQEHGRQTVQTSVWLVGLASALLTTLGIKELTLSQLLPEAQIATIVCLVAVVVFGVVQRLLYQITGLQQIGQPPECAVFDLSGRTGQHQKPAVATPRQGLLGDQILR